MLQIQTNAWNRHTGEGGGGGWGRNSLTLISLEQSRRQDGLSHSEGIVRPRAKQHFHAASSLAPL